MVAKELRDRIVADVSGDLSPDESEQLLYELLQDPEGRQLHQSLERDRDALRNLTRLSVDSELSQQVLVALALQSPIIRLAKTKRKTPVRWPIGLGLALGLGLAFIAAWMISDRTRPAVVNRLDDKVPGHVATVPKPDEKPTVPVEPSTGDSDIVRDQPETPKSTPSSTRTEPAPVKKSTDVLTAPSIPRMNPVQVTKPRISLPMSAVDLISGSGRDAFRAELARDADHRLELFTHEPARLAEELVRLGKSKSASIAVEGLPGEAIRRKGRLAFALYVENWAPSDLIMQLRQLAKDRKFETLVVTGISDGDRRELRQLLGRDPLETESEEARKADSKRSGADSPSIRGYLSFFPPPKVSTLTKDQLSFWDRRSERSPGKLRLYLILRPL